MSFPHGQEIYAQTEGQGTAAGIHRDPVKFCTPDVFLTIKM